MTGWYPGKQTLQEREHPAAREKRLYNAALDQVGPFTIRDISNGTATDNNIGAGLLRRLCANGDLRRIGGNPHVYEWIND